MGASNGSRALSIVGGNGGSKTVSSSSGSRIGSLGSSSNSMINPNFDGKGTYLVFNVGDTIFISDLNSQDKVIWYLQFPLFGQSSFCLLIESFLLNLGSNKIDTF